MIVASIAIAGLLLSNKDDVVSFINKHNNNWFERNLVRTQINKQKYHDKGNQNPNDSSNSSASNKLIGLGNEKTVKNSIRMTDKLLSQTPVKLLSGASRAAAVSQPSVITITNPPISTEEITTHYPAWESLINKIVNSNKNDLAAMNSLENVDKTLSTVAIAQFETTTNLTPTKPTTLAPDQHESSMYRKKGRKTTKNNYRF